MLKSKVLKVLEENKGKTVSGAEMAKTLNLSRTSIWKAINSLRDDGYNINAVTNKGYSLADNTDLISKEGISLYLNKELFLMIENTVDFDLLCRLFATQLTTKGEKHLLDHNRVYYKLLRKIIVEGQQKGELTEQMTPSEMVKYYALCERGMMYDWCLSNGEYSLCEYAKSFMPFFLGKIRKSV